MIKKIFTLFVLSTLLPLVAYADSAANTNLTQLLRNIRTMQADFTQTLLNKSSKLIRNTQGRMALQRPGMFRWEVTQPVAQLIIANGRKLWIYDKDLEQVTIRTLASGAGETPALLLSDANIALEKEFYVKQAIQTSPASQVFVLLPKDKGSLFTSVRISFLNQMLAEMQLQDHLGQTIRIQFKKIKTNIVLPSSLFHLTPPANVDVIDETRPVKRK